MKEAGVDPIVELGAGKVLSGLVKRIDRDIAASSAGTPEELEALAKDAVGPRSQNSEVRSQKAHRPEFSDF